MYSKNKCFLVVLSLFFLASLIITTQAQAQSTSIDPSTLVALTNADRAAEGLPSLTINPVLEAVARAKAQDMVKGEYFSHTSPAGRTPWYWFKQSGYTYAYAGENLAIDFGESISVETAWMNSPLHRKNILDAHFTEIGIVALKGTYQGHETVYVVQLFGTPAKVIAKVKSVPAKTVATVAKPATSRVLGASTTADKPKIKFTKKV